MAKRYYRPELDALRFFAFACVFIDHQHSGRPWMQYVIDTGMFGMCIFFMLSAYLIVSILIREKETTGTVSIKRFAIRRILRIWPLYYLVLFAAYLIGLFVPSAYFGGGALFAFSFLLGNVYILSHGWIDGIISPLWSLSVEEQFYLVVPAVARLGGRTALIVISVFTILLAQATLVWEGMHGAIPIVGVWTNSFIQFQFFAAGGLIALWFHGNKLRMLLPSRCALAAFGIGSWLVASMHYHLRSFWPSTARQLVIGYMFLMIGTIAIFLSVLDLDRKIPQPLIYLGKISYGLYLFHPGFVWLLFATGSRWQVLLYFSRHPLQAIPVIFMLTVAAASLSYHFFERPILKYKEKFETVRTRPA